MLQWIDINHNFLGVFYDKLSIYQFSFLYLLGVVIKIILILEILP